MQLTHRRRLLIAIVSGAVILIVLIVIGIFGLLRAPAPTETAETPTPQASASSATPVPADQPQSVRETSDPEQFVRSVAQALFTWDTRDAAGPSEWAQQLVDVANPAEAAGLAADVRAYLPGAEMWERLRGYGTRQWLDIDSVTVPTQWATALEQAAEGQIPPGTGAYTVVGTRQRAGTVETEDMGTEQLVSFTVFVVCSDTEPCTLLRLSQLDHPLK